MIEKIKAVNNPLTIIAIFAGLAEIAGTIALATVDKSLQVIFIWFVMGFPTLLVILFFTTLNFNPKVLYAPSDFKDEKNFLSTLIGTRNVSKSLDQMPQHLEDTKQKIMQQTLEEITTISDLEREKFTEIVNRQLNDFEKQLESLRKEADNVANNASNTVSPKSIPEAMILEYLASSDESKNYEQIAKQTGLSLPMTVYALENLLERRLVTKTSYGESIFFTVY